MTDSTKNDRDRIIQIIMDEYARWREPECSDERQDLIAMGALSASANILVRFMAECPENESGGNKA